MGLITLKGYWSLNEGTAFVEKRKVRFYEKAHEASYLVAEFIERKKQTQTVGAHLITQCMQLQDKRQLSVRRDLGKDTIMPSSRGKKICFNFHCKVELVCCCVSFVHILQSGNTIPALRSVTTSLCHMRHRECTEPNVLDHGHQRSLDRRADSSLPVLASGQVDVSIGAGRCPKGNGHSFSYHSLSQTASFFLRNSSLWDVSTESAQLRLIIMAVN